jgi:uncharacterized protein YdeI (YjbR/CyaY-like superfamily)
MPTKPTFDDSEQFATRAQWRRWLTRNAAKSDGIWMRFAKKGSGKTTLSYDEAVEEALCFGWIDSQVRTLDADFYVQRFTPRRPRGVWSKTNVERVERMLAQGRMTDAGMREVEAAKADGRWAHAYKGSATAEPHLDLVAGLKKNPAARAFFASLNKANRYAVIWRVNTARTEATRAKRIAQLVAMLARGETFH